MVNSSKSISEFIRTNFKHFNSAVVVDAAEAWVNHLKAGNKMFLAMAGAMSTAELGISLAALSGAMAWEKSDRRWIPAAKLVIGSIWATMSDRAP